jgi:hypothetical protein
MSDLYIIDFSGGEEERARREAERAAQHARVRTRYGRHVVDVVGVDEITAELVMSALFDHFDVVTGEPCQFGNHPKLPEPDSNGDEGFDCRCGWNQERRDAEHAAWCARWEELQNSAESLADQARWAAEQAEVEAWIGAHPGVVARQTSTACPEQWEGSVDGRSFYFRERHGQWRIELDMEPNGRFAQRFVGTDEAGEMVTEPVELTEGTESAQCVEAALGETTIDHLAFIVRTIRDHVTGEKCPHAGALVYCPTCGVRTGT